jgi:peroxiredoxin
VNAWIALVVFGILGATITEHLLIPERKEPPPKQAASPYDPKFAGPFKIGDVAPDFSLKDAKGRTVSLSQYRGKRVLLNFYCGCSFCREVATTWTNMLSQPRMRPTALLAVCSFGPDYDQQFRKESGWKGVVLYDEKPFRPVAVKYDSKICPRVWVLDEQGKIMFTNPSPVQVPPGPELEMAVRPFISLDPPGDIHKGLRDAKRQATTAPPPAGRG